MGLACDLAVLGGGPAGAVSARLAARDGLRVILVDPGRGPRRIEGMSPRLHRWLAGEGLLEGLDGLIGPLPRQTDWSGLGAAVNGEFLVGRAALDAHLRAAAVAAGAEEIRGSGRPEPGGIRLADGRWIAAAQVLDARGRAAHGAEAAARRGPVPTLSICAFVAPALGPIAPGLRISALPEGWIWRAALPDGRIWAQLTVDAASPLPPEARLRNALAASAPELGDPRLEGAPLVRATAPVLPAPLDDLACLPVGDAFAAMDPLLGHGQFWAVSSALAAAAVRRTLAARPGAGSEALCRRFLAERAQETCLRNARIGRDFLRLETRFADRPFWAARRDFPDDRPAHDLPPAIRIETAAVVRGGLVEEMEILKTPRTPAGIGWFGEIPAAEAFRMLRDGRAEAESRARFGLAPERLAALLAREETPLL